MVSLQQVADLAGVSGATASRVLSGSSHPVAAATRQRVLDAARELDFQPNLLASGLARRRMQAVAVIVHDMMDEYFSEIARGIEDEAYANGYVTLICNTDRDPAKEIHYLRKLRSMQVDAVLFTAGGLRDRAHRTEVVRQLDQIELAGGVIVRLAPVTGGQPDIAYSNTVGLRLAVGHLVGLGHAEIGFVAGPADIATSLERLTAMRRAMRRHDLGLLPELVFDGSFSRAGGEVAAAQFVDAGCPATAMVCANDQAAIGFMRGLRDRGVAVPDRVSVMGYDDIAPCSYIDPPLTTIHVPLYELGARGMQAALAMLDGAPRGEPEELPLRLTIRSSCAPPQKTRRTRP